MQIADWLDLLKLYLIYITILKKPTLYGQIVASVLLKLFIIGN